MDRDTTTILVAIARVEEKLDAVMARQVQQDSEHSSLREYTKSISARTGTLERWQSRAQGAVALFLVLLGAGGGVAALLALIPQ